MNTPYRESKVCEKCVARERGSRWEFNSAMSTGGDGPRVSGMQMLFSCTALILSMVFMLRYIALGLDPMVRRLGIRFMVLTVVALLMRVERKR